MRDRPPGRRRSVAACDGERGQLSLPLVEAVVGALLVAAVAMGFALGVPEPGTRTAQLDAYADDATTLLATDPPAGTGTSRLAAASRSTASFDRERAALAARLDELLPAAVVYRLRTPAGSLGYRPPTGRPVGRAVTPTAYGSVVLEVWYA
jgi:hypothetical protein